MNKDLEEMIEKKMDEIKEIVKQYAKSLYGDIEIERIEVEDKLEKENNGATKRKIEIYVTSSKGYFSIQNEGDVNG